MLKTGLRAAGLAPGVGIVPDAAAGAITLAQRAKAKDPERKKELNREIAGDAAAMIPGVGQGTRGAQFIHKAAKGVRGGKKSSKVRRRTGAAVRKFGPGAVNKTKAALRARAAKPEAQSEGLTGAAGGAVLGGMVAGPLGAIAGAGVGHKIQKNRERKKKHKELAAAAAEAAAKQDEVSEAFSFYRRLGKTIYENAGLPTGPIAKHYTGVKRKNIGDGKVKSDVNKAVKKIEKKIRTKVGPGADTPNLVAQAQKKNRARNRNRKLGLGPENPNDREADFKADKERMRAPGDR